ncbi:hypothetical protein Rleg_5930 (plasmid) [Rhizobium leguminosarum bv. trifolii WSM1325]|uniref:Uncharacterized protein n=1 Tax=Rhizobium leguminosarum bv. trifolii (strain WSM1325) TaxID=395491 RepID=C6B8G2_RHILS|nr:hypothetical protein Rleg_5930 [Rhizobium leguminosarum bv. trifolii WSM1325]
MTGRLRLSDTACPEAVEGKERESQVKSPAPPIAVAQSRTIRLALAARVRAPSRPSIAHKGGGSTVFPVRATKQSVGKFTEQSCRQSSVRRPSNGTASCIVVHYVRRFRTAVTWFATASPRFRRIRPVGP